MQRMRSFKQLNNKRIFKLFAAVIALLVCTSAVAQKKWSLTFRPGVDFPTKDLGNTSLKTGFGFEGTVAYRVMAHLAVYGGWSWNKFASEKPFAGSNLDFEETGYCYGLQFTHPIKDTKLSLIIRGGGLYNHIEVENTAGTITADSGHGFGWEIETGLSLPLSSRWQLQPGIRYRSLSRDLQLGGAKTAVDLNYISLGVGATWTFGK